MKNNISKLIKKFGKIQKHCPKCDSLVYLNSKGQCTECGCRLWK